MVFKNIVYYPKNMPGFKLCFTENTSVKHPKESMRQSDPKYIMYFAFKKHWKLPVYGLLDMVSKDTGREASTET